MLFHKTKMGGYACFGYWGPENSQFSRAAAMLNDRTIRSFVSVLTYVFPVLNIVSARLPLRNTQLTCQSVRQAKVVRLTQNCFKGVEGGSR